MPRHKTSARKATLAAKQLVRRYKETGEAGEASTTVEDWRRLFDAIDRRSLWAAGAAVPDREIAGFRGVAGGGVVDGLSWSTSLDVACWFAVRRRRPKPAIYLATIEPSEVYVIFNENSGEQEIVAFPKQRYRLAISAKEVKRRADRYLAAQGE